MVHLLNRKKFTLSRNLLANNAEDLRSEINIQRQQVRQQNLYKIVEVGYLIQSAE